MQIIKCNICGKHFKDLLNKSGILSKHIKVHNITNTSNIFDYYTLEYINDLNYISCPICNWKTIDLLNKSGQFKIHINAKHNLTEFEFIEQYPLYKQYFNLTKRVNEKNINNYVICKICGKKVKRINNTHLLKHNITLTEYKNTYGYNNIVSKISSKKQSIETTKNNMKIGGYINNRTSSYELDFKNKLDNSNINYIFHYVYNNRTFDFYLPDYNSLIEIDGTVYHPNKLNNLTFMTLNSCINDYNKEHSLNDKKLYRIYWDKSFSFTNIDELFNVLNDNIYKKDYTIDTDNIIISKDYFIRYKNNKGSNKIHEYINLLLTFKNIFIKDFPFPTVKNDLNLNSDYIIQTFFKSYWKQSNLNSISPFELYNNNEKLYDIFKYILGINDNNEVYDFTKNNILKIMEYKGYTVKLFNPTLLYKSLFINISNPIVFDPIMNFGSSLLLFINNYKNGTYIGCEYNNDIYKELLLFKKYIVDNTQINDNQIILYNCSFLDFKQYDLNYNVLVTYIPTYNTEIYNTYITEFYKYNNVYIAINNEIFDKVEINSYTIFDKYDNEIIIQL